MPADSLEYFGETLDGNTAFVGTPGAVGAVPTGARVGVAAGAGALAAGAGLAAVEALDPHSAFRKSFHFIPFKVPADCAALYLALHSCMVSA